MGEVAGKELRVMKQESFVIRAYGKSELAMMYYPRLSQASAAKKFRNELRTNPRLSHLGTKKKHDFTPKQVRLVVDELGEPF